MLEIMEVLPIRYAFMIPVLNSIGYILKHRTKLDNTLIPVCLFAIALATGILIRGFQTSASGWVYWLDVVVYHGVVNGIKTTIYACGGYETVRAIYFHYERRRVEGKGEEKKMSKMTRTLLSVLAAFLIASAVFCAISLIFGAGLFGAFAKLTDGLIFGILVMMAYDLLRRLAMKEGKVTKTYVAMQVLLLVNVVAFAMASVTTSRTFSLAGLAISAVAGISAGVLPYIVNHIQALRGDVAVDDEKGITAQDLQDEWARNRSRIVSAGSVESKRKMLERMLAYRCIGDSIYGALDLERPLIVYKDADGTAYALSIAAAKDKGVTDTAEASEYVDRLLEG